MAKAKKISKKKIFEIIAGVVLAIILVSAGWLWLIHNKDADNGKNTSSPSAGQRLTVEGEYVCLPKGDGPQTLECAFGLYTDDGTYYALDFADLMTGNPAILADLAIGDRLEVSGEFTEEESMYTSKGRITVETFEEQ